MSALWPVSGGRRGQDGAEVGVRACVEVRGGRAQQCAVMKERAALVHRPGRPPFHRPAPARLAAVDPGRV